MLEAITVSPESRPLRSVITPHQDPDLRVCNLEFAMFYLSQAVYACRVSRIENNRNRRHNKNKTALTPRQTIAPVLSNYSNQLRILETKTTKAFLYNNKHKTHNIHDKMGKGSCYCGKVAFSYSGEPANKASPSPSLPSGSLCIFPSTFQLTTTRRSATAPTAAKSPAQPSPQTSSSPAVPSPSTPALPKSTLQKQTQDAQSLQSSAAIAEAICGGRAI